MGRIGFVLSVSSNTEGGEDIPVCKVDLGGKDIRTVPLFNSTGIDARPRAGDYVALVEHPGGNGYAAVAFSDPGNASISGDGEVRITARNSGGTDTVEIYLKADGSVRIENERGFIALAANGRVTINDNFTVDP